MPVGEVIGGAALGIVLQLLHDAIKKAKDRSLTTRYILNRLDATIFSITPLVVKIDKLSEEAEDSERQVIEDLKLHLGKAISLVDAYSKLRRRNLLMKYRYTIRIKEAEASLRWIVDVGVQVNQWLDIKELMVKISEMNTKLDKMTRPPTDCHCFKKDHSISQSTKQSIVEANDRSPEANDECSSDGSTPKIDIHLRWSSRKQSKDREIRFTVQ